MPGNAAGGGGGYVLTYRQADGLGQRGAGERTRRREPAAGALAVGSRRRGQTNIWRHRTFQIMSLTKHRFLEEGSENYVVPRMFSNQVLGQHRFLEERLGTYFALLGSKAPAGNARVPDVLGTSLWQRFA